MISGCAMLWQMNMDVYFHVIKYSTIMGIMLITEEQVEIRKYWIEEIGRLSGDFGIDAERVERQLSREIQVSGIHSLLGHLRLCGAIPESYRHNSSEEKLYSKYTDVVIHEAFKAIGFTSLVLKERADAADVECVTDTYSFVADAKAFRLSRTAKNQKDFKVEAMNNWKHGKPYAIIVCPVYQLPSQTSQIYQQASSSSVFVATYTHLAVLARFAQESSEPRAVSLFLDLFKAVEALNPSKSAPSYWTAVNRTLLDFDDSISSIWREEKLASNEAIQISKEEALTFLATERSRIMRLSREEAIKEVLRGGKLDNKIQAIRSVAENRILSLE